MSKGGSLFVVLKRVEIAAIANERVERLTYSHSSKSSLHAKINVSQTRQQALFPHLDSLIPQGKQRSSPNNEPIPPKPHNTNHPANPKRHRPSNLHPPPPLHPLPHTLPIQLPTPPHMPTSNPILNLPLLIPTTTLTITPIPRSMFTPSPPLMVRALRRFH